MQKRPISTLLTRTLGATDKTWISMGQLEKNIMQSTKTRIDNLKKLPTLATGKSDINIVSPFYDRNKICKNINCLCPYHKRIKMQALKKFRAENNKKAISSHPSPNKQSQTVVISPRMSFNHSVRKQNMTPIHKNLEKLDFNSIGKQVDSYNKQFQDFLKEMNQMLLKKGQYQRINNHKIKTSVQKIFRYIYNNLDKEKQVISEYVNSIEKDRDITQFYLQRYQDLRYRKDHKPVIQRVDSFRTDRKGENGSQNAKKQSIYHRKGERHFTTLKTNKKKTQRHLLIVKMIKDIEGGLQIQQQQINQFKDLNLQLFQQNCLCLQQRLQKIDLDTLQQIKQDILLRLNFDKQINQQQQPDSYKKAQMIDHLLKKINGRISEIQQQNDKQFEKQQYDRISSTYSKVSASRKGSSDHRGSRRPSKFFDVNMKSKFMDIGIQQEERRYEQNESKSQQDEDEKQMNEPGRHSNKLNTIFGVNQCDHTSKQTSKRTGKLKLAKHRRLSHQGFFQKPFFCDEDYNFSPHNILGSTRQQISQGLDNLASQFGDNWKKMKQIQRRISGMKMNKLIVNPNDSLITAKRKARLLKNLLKENAFQGTVKEQIKEYIGLIQQFNLVKNRQWAENRLRKMAGIGTSDETQMGESTQEPTEDLIKKMLNEIFSKKKKLLYYLVDQMQFQQIEINLEGHLFQSLQRQLQLQHKRSQNDNKRKTQRPLKKQVNKQRQKRKNDDELIQSGLQDHYISQFCYEETVNVLRNNRSDLEQTSPNIRSMNNSILFHLRQFSKYGF